MRRLAAACLATAGIGLAVATSAGASRPPAVAVAQKNRDFAPRQVAISRGDVVRFTNQDEFLHQLFVHAPGFSFDSGEQEPGRDLDVVFPVAGTFTVLCGIHPKMKLAVEVK